MSSLTAADVFLRAIREGLILALVVSAPPLIASLMVGLVVSIMQAATQIQDPTIAFVPKLVAVLLVLVASGPLLAAHVVRFAQALFLAIPMVR
jgi:flagellar biosynthetic protein FliQ